MPVPGVKDVARVGMRGHVSAGRAELSPVSTWSPVNSFSIEVAEQRPLPRVSRPGRIRNKVHGVVRPSKTCRTERRQIIKDGWQAWSPRSNRWAE